MVTNGNGRGRHSARGPSLLLTLVLCVTMALGLGAATPVHALTLSGTVANDVNGSGMLDGGDLALAGIQVSIQPSAGGVIATTTTLANGTYSFTGLAPNTYTVTVGSVTGLSNETPGSVMVALATDLSGVNFLFTASGGVGSGVISGSVVSDLNGNGFAEPGEPGIPGVLVDIRRTDNSVITTATTGLDGTFSFINVPAGTYLIVQQVPVGAVPTGASAGSSGAAAVLNATTIRVTLTPGQSATGLNFADRTTPTNGISGFVYDDTNRSNTIDPGFDQPLPNVVVELRDAAQNLLNTTLTDVSGQYFFGSLAPGGTYVIRVQPPPGEALKLVFPTLPATRLGTSAIVVQNFNPSFNYSNNNFLLGPQAVVSPVTPGAANAISGKVFNDLTGNGGVNAGEPGLAGATLTLVSSTGQSFGSIVTTLTGEFIFVNLPAGDYTLTETNPPGYVSTGVQPGVGGTSINLDTIQIHVTGTNNLFSGQIFLDQASTVVSPTVGSISGRVFQDANGNGFLDGFDTGLGGVTIQLFTQLGFVRQTSTAANGSYSFTNLPPGFYRVVKVNRAGDVSLNAYPGPFATFVNVDTLAVTVSMNMDSGNNNFLVRSTVVSPTAGSISGRVFQDVNGNGFLDNGDIGRSGVTIQLFTQLGFVRQTSTDSSGSYSFTDLPPGFYRVVKVNPFGVSSLNAYPGPNGAFVDVNTIQVLVMDQVNSGANNFLVSAVVTPPTGNNTISGFAIRDLNFNGQPDNEPGLAGMTVTIRNAFGNVLAAVITNSTGIFSFSGLASGTYTLTAQPPGPLTSTNAFAGQGGTRLGVASISVTTTPGTTNYPGQLFLAGP